MSRPTAPIEKPTAAALAAQPITTEPNVTHYEWAGATLKRMFRSTQAISETWAFFSGPQQPARIAGGRGMTMEELVTMRPDVLGPAGTDPDNHGQKYFFVKFLDPSDFPPFAYVGFRPEAVATMRTAAALKARVAELLWQDRQAVEQLAQLARPRIGSAEAFARFKAAYKRWAITQAPADWMSPIMMDLDPFIEPTHRAEAREALERQRHVRRTLMALMHRIEFTEDQAILVETPTLHAIAGLSLQVHPNTPGNFHPKDELWIYRHIPLPDGAEGWILVEPQRTFDRTESGADFFTPYAWEGNGASGRLGFRKPISQASLEGFVALLDVTPHPQDHYLRSAERMVDPDTSIEGQAQWFRLVEDERWPHFFVRELRFDGAGASTARLPHHSFIELHATQGEIDVLLTDQQGRTHQTAVSPTHPVFLPATLPYGTITYRARARARLQYFSRRTSMSVRSA